LWGDNQLLSSLIGPLRYRPIEETLEWMYATAVASSETRRVL